MFFDKRDLPAYAGNAARMSKRVGSVQANSNHVEIRHASHHCKGCVCVRGGSGHEELRTMPGENGQN